jgi:5,10-methenyltetrahydrofolate synthetase
VKDSDTIIAVNAPKPVSNPPNGEEPWQPERKQQRAFWRQWRTSFASSQPQAHHQASALIRERMDCLLGALSDQVEGLRVGLYWPIEAEPDWRDAAPRWRARGIELLLPVVLPGRVLKFRRWNAGSTISVDRWGIGFPKVGPWCAPDVLIAPCLAIDPRGFRLGYGGGYYDRFQAMHPVPLFGVAFSRQQVLLADQPHDRRLAGWITERELRVL